MIKHYFTIAWRNLTKNTGFSFINIAGLAIEDGSMKMNVIGVVKDFIIKSPYRPVDPVVIAGIKRGVNILHIKYNGKNSMKDNLANAE